MPLAGQIRQEIPHRLGTQRLGMLLAMIKNVAPRPIDIRLFRAQAVMPQSNFSPHPIKQLGRIVRDNVNFHPRNFRLAYTGKQGVKFQFNQLSTAHFQMACLI